MTWGTSNYGGDSSDVTLSDVRKIYSTGYAVAALQADGSVVTWGDPDYGGDSSGVTLSDVREIYSNDFAFVAI